MKAVILEEGFEWLTTGQTSDVKILINPNKI